MSEVDMVRFLDVGGIIQIAVFTVGVTQLVKQLLSIEKAKLKVVATIIVGLIGGLILHFLPSWVFTTFLGVSVGVVFYDFILKFLERLVKGAGQ